MRALLLVGLLALPAQAGESGAAFLKIAPGARPAALGEAFGGLADDVHAGYYNPAGLGRLDKVQAAGSHEARFADMSYDYAAVSVPLLAWVDSPRPRAEFGVLALSVFSLSVDGIERRGNTETDEPIDTFKAGDLAYALSYGLSLPESPWSFGATVKRVESRMDAERAAALAFDAGALYSEGRWSAGAGARHVGQGQRFREQADPLPRQLWAGGSYRWATGSENGRLGGTAPGAWLLTAELSHPLGLGLGVERRKSFGRKLEGAVRGGYNTARRDPGGLAGAALGLGLTYDAFTLDFAWLPGGELGDGFKYSLMARF